MTGFNLLHEDSTSRARAGEIQTDHGLVHTPVFMPVGTSATVKAVHQQELAAVVKAEIILGNTYHLYLRPGLEVIEAARGLHQFMNWQGPILTDSGGYQVFSLSARRKIKPEGVTFQSHIDGSKHIFTPESVVDTQRILGSDIMMALDECPPYPCTRKYAEKSLKITNDWLIRGIEHFKNTAAKYEQEQIFVPIAQGSVFDDLRKESILFNSQYSNPIYALGGLSVGEPQEELYRMVALSTEFMPRQSARYLMGVGTPANLLECIGQGIDMFDCVLPTRNARHGIIYTTRGIIHIRNQKWKTDFSMIDDGLEVPTSNLHSKAYLRHLFMVGEILAAQIASIQNLSFYTWLMREARKQILLNNFDSWKREILITINQKL
ncbi:MAG: tRNA guanosine(34) transglycosylase Tgt [Saprospiraceae bacterium]|nr:tRNA guanosine(34) transglycosylase Tgt [Candidatus Vicinibacter affinis]MBK6822554.1 tRNA guanosine(34) transglycosylase Tgt [Candidatus Vicinibacter affinis]MBK7692797.1 tRNA guanosine(34) transglycosylase Tgt [Candidatus Vicinibacter affinis]MBK7797600.1 tRNA guanosine(34) transglycosylase Tgt [Candidatus Vicinibacter affinis]MBP6172909.1 tRNA guanosine(34) transglycosylase Tgt [Saprospiraceae bacterium]